MKEGILIRTSNVLEKILNWISIITIIALTVNMIVAVLFRYALNNPLFWADELSLVLFAWLTFLGGSLAVKRSEMVAITIFIDRLSGRKRKIFSIIIQLLIIFFSVTLGYYATIWAISPSVFNMVSPTLGINMWILYSIIPISMICITIFSLNNIQRILFGKGVYGEEGVQP